MEEINNKNEEIAKEQQKDLSKIKEKTADARQSKQSKKSQMKNKKPHLKKRIFVPIIVFFVLLAAGVMMSVHSHYYQTTDDAFVEGHIVSIAPRVSGPVIKLYVKDNQEVKKGDLILEIDPTDYKVALSQKEALLLETKASLKVSNNNIMEKESDFKKTEDDLTSAKSRLDFAKKTHNRNEKLKKDGIVSLQEYDKSKTDLVSSAALYNSELEKNKTADIQIQSSKSKKEEVLAQIKKLQSEVDQAKLNLEYTKIHAPSDGRISSRSVEAGNFVQVAQPLLAIVSDDMWVVANFKETQLAKVKVGQSVIIKIDTYKDVKFSGKVDSIQRSTGAKASLFPPENAVGSYVKIVQRVPVKIIFDKDYSQYNIVPGMSVVPKIRVKQ